MDNTAAIGAFSALAQDTRLAVFRLLVEAGPEGIPAGDLARLVQVPHNTLSSHLGILARAGLVLPRREGRSVFYAADFAGMRALVAYLVQDCCKGRPEICGPLADIAARACAPAPSRKESPSCRTP